jgi:Na+/H+ antiporter NhaD/arsenite permease-like protein
MKTRNVLFDLVLKEWLLVASGTSFLLTSIYSGQIPDFSLRELQVLFILFVLFVAVNGLKQSGVISKLSHGIGNGRAVPFKLVVVTFFLSMFVTNDVALIVVVPVTMALSVKRKGILVILEALSANAGSALTPFGNPQNLFIYWFYDLQPIDFISEIAPFSLVFLIILSLSTIFIKQEREVQGPVASPVVGNTAYIYGVYLVITLLTVLHVLPVSVGLLIIISALLFDRKVLSVDYSLLMTFFFFFGLGENMKIILETEITHQGHTFLFSALLSQVISNVPATLLFSKFTDNWQALLWGVNTGGFGSLFGSLANLIAYKIYVSDESTNDSAMFTVKFHLLGYVAFFLSIGLYFFMQSL